MVKKQAVQEEQPIQEEEQMQLVGLDHLDDAGNRGCQALFRGAHQQGKE